jgi:L-fuconolactonase
MIVVDGYCHCGLTKYEPVERVEEVMTATGVERAVLVQHLGEFDNSYLGRIAAANPARFAAVGLIDHERAACIDTLQRWTEAGCFKGMRMTTEALAAHPALADAAVELGLVIVLYAPHGIAPAIRPIETLFKGHPEACLVLSHLANPDPADAPRFSKWSDTLRLAEHTGVYVQLSGMKMFCPWPHEPLYPLIEQTLERFGASRVYWGSNFPVVGGTRDYLDDLSLLLEGKLPIVPSDIPAIAGENAKALWFADRWHTHRLPAIR